jgi:reactive intermediate/imine deaminase
MADRTRIHSDQAPKAIGTYSQAIRHGDTLYVSGQIPLDPATGELVGGDFEAQCVRVFENLKAIAEAAGGSLDRAVKVNCYLLDFAHFAVLNAVMARYFKEPYPARATVAVAALPRGVPVEVDVTIAL